MYCDRANVSQRGIHLGGVHIHAYICSAFKDKEVKQMRPEIYFVKQCKEDSGRGNTITNTKSSMQESCQSTFAIRLGL